MESIFESLSDTIKARLSNSLTGTFILSWIVFHWRLLFAALFVDQDKIFIREALLKDEYLLKTYFNIHDYSFWIWLIIPFLSTYLIIWKLPKWIGLRAHQENEEYETQKAIISLAEKRKIEKQKTQLEEEQTTTLKASSERILEEKKIADISPQTLWEREYDKLRESKIYPEFDNLMRSIYGHRGLIEDYDFHLSTEILSYSDASGLISQDAPNHIALTDKGKYFIKKYIESEKGFF